VRRAARLDQRAPAAVDAGHREHAGIGRRIGGRGGGSVVADETTGDERSTWSSASQKSAEIRQRLTRTTGDVQTRIARSMRENPLAYGVAALAAGALMGSLMPRTEVEDEYLGETRDSLLDSAREMAEDTVQKLAGNESPGQAAAGSSGFGGSASGVTGTSAGGGGIRTSSGRTAGTSGSTGAGTSTAATGMGGSQLDAGTSGTSQSGRGTSGSFGEAESAAGPASGTGTRKRRTSNTPDESGGMGSLG
jgi:hypothetical protein